MAMKKGFLPALMAGMVVVGSTGLVNADSDMKTVTGDSGRTLSSDVYISGRVANKQGEEPGGKLTVELPTRMTFAVDKDGAFKGGSYKIKNNSKDSIAVSVSDFRKISGDINVVKTITQESTRKDVKLTLQGYLNKVNLEEGNILQQAEQDLVQVEPNGGVRMIDLTGAAGKKENKDVDDNGATGEFCMVFKIKKVNS